MRRRDARWGERGKGRVGRLPAPKSIPVQRELKTAEPEVHIRIRSPERKTPVKGSFRGRQGRRGGRSRSILVPITASICAVAIVAVFLVVDWDKDGLATITELRGGTGAFNPDTDEDNLKDGVEVNAHRTDPRKWDTDGDNLGDGLEVNGWSITVENLAQGVTSDPLVQDTDGDNLSDWEEYRTHLTNPCSADTDSDGLDDWLEVHVHATSPLMGDTDADGLGDGPEVKTHRTDPLRFDTDGDNLGDGLEVTGWSITVEGRPVRVASDPLSADSDGDNLSDWEERSVHGTDPRSADTDGEGLSDELEVRIHRTNPLTRDTDGDGLDDRAEIYTHRTDPLNPDTDGDGLNDRLEVMVHGTNPFVPDSDGDGLTDGAEVNVHGTSPTNPDTDGDSGLIFPLNDYQEIYVYGTNPLHWDTDGDGLGDGQEIEVGTDPRGSGGGRDPTYSEMLDFIRRDRTDEKPYIEDVYVCYHFAAEVGRNADREGIRSAFVIVRFPSVNHALVAFNTVDKGLIFIEPQTDEEMKVEVGKPYWPRDKYLPPSYDDTVLEISIYW